MTDAPDMEQAALEAAVRAFEHNTDLRDAIRAYLAARSAPEAGKAVDFAAGIPFDLIEKVENRIAYRISLGSTPRAIAEDVLQLALASSPSPTGAEPVAWRPTHRHKKRGSTYRVIAQGRLQVDADLDNEKVVVYRGEDGQVWVRPTYEFNDGRFETLPAAPLPEDTHHG